MADRAAVIRLPVFLPGSNHDWEMADGIGTVTADGKIEINLRDRGAAIQMVEQAKDGIFMAISFAVLDETEEAATTTPEEEQDERVRSDRLPE